MSISSKEFCSPEDIEKKNLETTTDEEDEMQKYKKRILQSILDEKIIPTDLKYWLFFHLLKPEFMSQIHMIYVFIIPWPFGIYNNEVIIVTNDKNVYNLHYKRNHLKIDETHTALEKIKELCGKNIKTFAYNEIFILALTEEGEVYFCEIAKKWNFNEWSFDISTFIRDDDLSNKRIVDIACGGIHGLALTSDGKVYEWGKRKWKENNSQVETITHFNVPRQVKHKLETKKVVSIACGLNFNTVVTDENELYGWGHTIYRSHGWVNLPKKYYKYPREIIKISDKIVKVVCGHRRTLALTDKGEVYSWLDEICKVGVNSNGKPVNVPQMKKILNVYAYGEISAAVDCDRSLYVWGEYFDQRITQPFRTKFSRVFDIFEHNLYFRQMHKPLIVHNSAHIVQIMNNYNYKYTEGINILESLGAAFDDPLTSDFTIQVEGQPIYVHKAIIKIRCQCFFDSILDSSSVYTISDKFSYIVYKAFLKYLYTGTINLPSENALELMELADMYCETNLKKDCSQIIKQTITVSNVAFFYNKAIECNVKELEKFCFQFALRHKIVNTLSENYIKLDMNTKTKIVHRELIQNDVTITSSTFYSPNKSVKRKNSEMTKKDEIHKYEKRILEWILAEKITSTELKYWPCFHLLTSEFISQIHMVMIYDETYGCRGKKAIIVTKDKNVYNFNYYGKDLRISNLYTLREIKELCGKNIKTFARSDSFILALTEEGEVYFSEIGYDSRETVCTFIRVANLSDKRIVDMVYGENDVFREIRGLALTSDGKVYAWETNVYEEMDNEDADFLNGFLNDVRQVKHGLEKKNVVHIACSSSFSIIVTDENELYGWGSNDKGQISIVEPEKYYEYPHAIITISDKIVKVVCGENHTLVLTNKGEVLAWGCNESGQVGVNKKLVCGPTVVNFPEMKKVLDIAARRNVSVAIGYDRIIYVWGHFFKTVNPLLTCRTSIPFPTKFSNIYDAFAHSASAYSSLIVLMNNVNYIEEALNVLESLRAVFDEPLTSDLTIRVEGRPIYVHKAILKILCRYFKSMFQHNWIENIQSTSDSVYTVSEKFSYVVYKAFLKYLYTGNIDLPAENALELLELADMYCETNLIKDCSQKIKKVITVSNVIFFYNKAIEYNAKELEEFCFQFALHHITDVELSEDFIKLDKSIKDNFMRRAAEGNTFGISFI